MINLDQSVTEQANVGEQQQNEQIFFYLMLNLPIELPSPWEQGGGE